MTMYRNWNEFIEEQKKLSYFQKLMEKVDFEYQNYVVYPEKSCIFKSFDLTNISDVKVVLLGQDPYHEPNQAMGLSFSVYKNNKIPKSLINIYKELNSDLGIIIPTHGDLTSWAKEGVLLLNTILTVREHEALSHQNIGWEIFTDNVIKFLNTLDQPIVFLLWGSQAAKKASLLNNPKHLVITSAHPSPLSAYRGFFGSKPFSKINNFLPQPINFKID